ncbi:MAG TPA: DUF2232 domain-containing protein [Ktedonobacterales bacterium]
MGRAKLSAIEIAEGALLADVAVIFQVIWMYVPFVGIFFRMLIPVVFTVLVLRRNLRAGIMSLCVALFLAGVVTGPNIIDLIYLLLEGIGGLFLGVTMKRGLRDVSIVLLGTVGLAVPIYGLVFFTALLVGNPVADIVRSLHRDYDRAIAGMNFLAPHLGIGGIWAQHVYPMLEPLAALAFLYWWALLFVGCLVGSVPVNIIMYYFTNTLVRFLGYQVRPFPGGKINRLAHKIRRRLVRRAIKRARRRRGVARADRPAVPERHEVGV